MKSLDWMPFFGDHFWGSERVAQMDDAAALLYQWLLWRQFQHGPLPQPEILRRLPHRWQGEAFDRLWPQIAPCFELVAGDRLENRRCAEERAEALANHDKARKRAEAANAARWGAKKDGQPAPRLGPQGLLQGSSKDPATIHQTGPDRTGPDRTSINPPNPPSGGSVPEGSSGKPRRSERPKPPDRRAELPGLVRGTALDTPACVAALGEWLEHKREKGHGYKTTGLRGLVRKAIGFGPERLLAAVEHSIASNYDGLFMDAGAGRAPRQSTYDENMATLDSVLPKEAARA